MPKPMSFHLSAGALAALPLPQITGSGLEKIDLPLSLLLTGF